jgi:hypothetical protein
VPEYFEDLLLLNVRMVAAGPVRTMAAQDAEGVTTTSQRRKTRVKRCARFAASRR